MSRPGGRKPRSGSLPGLPQRQHDGWRKELTREQAARIVAAQGAVTHRPDYDVTLASLAAEQQDLVAAR